MTEDNTQIANIANKLEQFNEFFSIAYDFTVNITELSLNAVPTYEQFLEEIPLPFKMASEVATIDQSALRPIQGLSNVAGQLVEFLNFQSQKIELLIGYILSQQDKEEYRFSGHCFGGGGLVFSSDSAFDVGAILELKVFLLKANCAVFCYGEIIETESKDNTFQHKVIFHYIREEDREIMVRTSLHEQSKQLQALAKKRNKRT